MTNNKKKMKQRMASSPAVGIRARRESQHGGVTNNLLSARVNVGKKKVYNYCILKVVYLINIILLR